MSDDECGPMGLWLLNVFAGEGQTDMSLNQRTGMIEVEAAAGFHCDKAINTIPPYSTSPSSTTTTIQKYQM